MQPFSPNPRVLWENENAVFIYKPANILSVRSRFHTQNPRANIFDYFEQSKPALSYLPLHRLDFEVAGLLIAAKTTHAQKIISQYFEKRQIKKIYWAITVASTHSAQGKLPFAVKKIEPALGETYRWESKILRGKKRSYSSPAGDVAQTDAHYAGPVHVGSYCLHRWELRPRTGRSHQLRFELSRHEYPVVGDELYFAPLIPGFASGIALVAHALDFADCPGAPGLGIPPHYALNLTWADFLAQVQIPAGTTLAGAD